MIKVENLTKTYGDLLAIDDLSFSIEKGQIWGLLGPNAAGKTTTMRILAGYLSPTEGNATVADFDVLKEAKKVKAAIGYLPEYVPLYPEMTVTEYLTYVAAIKLMPKKERHEALEKSLTACGLEEVRKRLIRNLSHGYKQRVGIAQALIHDPDVLILDEPTVGLDPAQIKEIRELIKSLRGERTILLSTHILAEVTQICDGVAILNKGKLVTSVTLKEQTSSFKEQERALVKLKITGKAIINLIQGLPGVKKINASPDGLLVDWHPGQDPRDDIARLIGENKLGLIEIRPLTMNLEDLYLKAISGGVEQ